MTLPKVNTAKRVEQYLKSHRDRLVLLELMWNDPLVYTYNDPEMPSETVLTLGSLFIAGPTSRHQILECNWRCELVSQLRLAGYEGVIYIPEPRGLEVSEDFTERGYIHRWESTRLLSAEKQVFWIPRKADELLGLNTNFEFGLIVGLILAGTASDIFMGWPDEAERMGLPRHYAVELAHLKRHDTMRRLAHAVVEKVPIEDMADIDDDIPF